MSVNNQGSQYVDNKPPQQVKIENEEGHVYSNEKDFYMSNLRAHIKKVKIVIVFAFIICFINALGIYFFTHFFRNMFNMVTIIIQGIWNIILVFFFCRCSSDSEYMDASSYKVVVYSIYITLIVGLLTLFDLTFIYVKHILFDYNTWWNFIHEKASKKIAALSIGGLILYFIINIINPFYLVAKLLYVRNALRAYANLQGQEYSVTYTVTNPNSGGLGLESPSKKAEIK